MVLSTLLARNWKLACLISITLYVGIQLLIGLLHMHFPNGFCDSPPFAKWVWMARSFEAVAFSTKFLIKGLKYWGSGHLSKRSSINLLSAFAISITVSIIMSSSCLLTITLNWGGVCEDVFGVRTLGTQLGTWPTCISLLVFVVLAIERKPSFTYRDHITLACLTAFIVFLCVLPFSPSYGLSVFFLTASCTLGILSAVLLADLDVMIIKQLLHNTEQTSEDKFEIEENPTEEKDISKDNLLHIIFLTVPSYVLVYFLSFFHLINHDVTQLLFIICEVSSMLIFTTLAVDAHIQALYHAVEVQQAVANENRRAFLRYVMHEVRVPLSSISMGIDILSRHNPKNPREENIIPETLSMMNEASFFMSETLNSVLNLQKIEEGKFELALGIFSIRDMVRTVSLSMRGALAARHLDLISEIGEDIEDRLIGDRFRIEHVLANFLSNAIKFSPIHSCITIKTEKLSSNTIAIPIEYLNQYQHKHTYGKNKVTSYVHIRFSVIDSGSGISDKDQKKLFALFMQIRPDELQQGRGTGIGLSICKQIVEMHGGSVDCESKVGEGSTFSFTVPLGASPSSASLTSSMENKFEENYDTIRSERASTRENIATMGRVFSLPEVERPEQHFNAVEAIDNKSRSNSEHTTSIHEAAQTAVKHVLIVDDVRSNRRLLGLLLLSEGVVCDEGEDGLEAISMVEKNMDSYDVVFIDNMMPNMDGITATKRIRALGFDRFIVGLTGNALEDDVKNFLRAGADSVLIKPLKQELFSLLFAYIKQYGNVSEVDRKIYFNGSRFEQIPWVQ